MKILVSFVESLDAVDARTRFCTALRTLYTRLLFIESVRQLRQSEGWMIVNVKGLMRQKNVSAEGARRQRHKVKIKVK